MNNKSWMKLLRVFALPASIWLVSIIGTLVVQAEELNGG